MVRHMAHKQYSPEIPFKWELATQTRRESSAGLFTAGAGLGLSIPPVHPPDQ